MFTSLLLLTISLLTPILATTTTTSITTPNPTQVSKLSTYFTSLTAQPAYTSALSVMATAMPDSILESMEDAASTGGSGEGNGGSGPFAFGTGTQNVLTTQSWFTALPSEVKVYLSSVVQEERTLVGVKVGGAGRSGVSRGLLGMGIGVGAVLGVLVLL